MRRWNRTGVFVSALCLTFAVGCASAFAYDETLPLPKPPSSAAYCGTCHDPWMGSITTDGAKYGPHGGYLATTSKCEECHSVHDAPVADAKLLPAATITATCFTCHDGTATIGEGVYGAITGRGMTVGADHSVDTTNVVPGGNASNGGSATMVFSGVNGTLTCSDCHSPHGSDCVTPFLGERQRAARFVNMVHNGIVPVQVQNRLLKRTPGGAATPVQEYGSDWCAACHAGRPSGLSTHNHPVDSLVASGDPAYVPYNYRELGIVGTGPYPTASTVLGPAGIDTKQANQYNRAYLMPYPRTGAQAGHYPICQQCHEDTRDVGSLTADGTQASPSPAIVTKADGTIATDNPRFQNFPHETTGYRLLVEASTTGYTDGLCMNCHPIAALP